MVEDGVPPDSKRARLGPTGSSTLALSLEPPPPPAQPGEAPSDDWFALPSRLIDIDLATGQEYYSRHDPTHHSIPHRLGRIASEGRDFSALTEEALLNPNKSSAAIDDEKDGNKDEDDRPAPQDMRQLSADLQEWLLRARVELVQAVELLSILVPASDIPNYPFETLPVPSQTLTTLPVHPLPYAVPPPLPSTEPSASNSVPPPPPLPSAAGVDPSILNLSQLAALPLATSLDSLKSSANAFLKASSQLSPSLSSSPDPPPASQKDPWSTILHLHSKLSYPLMPLGATAGASLTPRSTSLADPSSGGGGTGGRQAREVGVFFGYPEAREDFRRRSVVTVKELVELSQATASSEAEGKGKQKRRKVGGRKLACRVVIGGKEEIAHWDVAGSGVDQEEEVGMKRVEAELRKRSREAFSEEVFEFLANEARTDVNSILKASLALSNAANSTSSITTSGHQYSLTLSLVPTSTPSPPPSTSERSPPILAKTILSLLHLLFLQDYAMRRAPPATLLWTRGILSTLGTVLQHIQRRRALVGIVKGLRSSTAAGTGEEEEEEVEGVALEEEGEEDEKKELARCVKRVVGGAKELGGLIVFRVGMHSFHLSHSLQLQHAPPPPGASPITPVIHHPLVLQSVGPSSSSGSAGGSGGGGGGGGAPVPVPSLSHLEAFWKEMVREVRGGLRERGRKVDVGKGKEG